MHAEKYPCFFNTAFQLQKHLGLLAADDTVYLSQIQQYLQKSCFWFIWFLCAFYLNLLLSVHPYREMDPLKTCPTRPLTAERLC